MIIQILGLIALCNSAVTRRLLQEEGEVALGGGWSEGHDVSEEQLGVWQNAVSKNSEGLLQNVDVATLGEPVSVTTQVVAGTNYKFVFADGSTATVYECPWENILDVTDIQVAKKETPLLAGFGGSGGVGPAWTYDSSIEPPAGTKDMGGWTAGVYTPEQEQKEVPADMNGVKTMVGSDAGSIGPEWTWNSKVEAPAGVKDMGSWKKAVFSEEQQQRLFVDEDGSPLKITDILLNRWGTGDEPNTNDEQIMVGANGHGLPPQTNEDKVIVGADGHGLAPQQNQLLGAGGHGLGPEWTRDDNKQVIVGADGHGLPPQQKQLLGADGHGLGPEWTRDDNKQMLGADGHGLGPQWTRENTLGGDGHDQQAHGLLGANGHGLGPEWSRKTNEPILGANGHGLGPIWTRGGIRLGSAGHGEGPKWTYDRTMENPEGEKDMGDYTMKVYTPEQQDRLGVTELGEKLLKKSSAKNKKITV